MVQLSHPYMTTGKTIGLTIQTFIVKVVSLLFNTMSRLVIAFLPGSKRLLISWLQSPSAMALEPQEEKICHCFYFFPFCLPWSDGPECHDLCFLVSSLKLAFLLSSFTLIKRLFSSSSLSARGVVSSTYMRLLILLLGVLILACDLSSLPFCMMFSANVLNKQDDRTQLCHPPFPIWNQSVVPCPVLTIAS